MPSVSRRSYLSLCGTVLPGGVAGCIGDPPSNGVGETGPVTGSDGASSRTPTATQTRGDDTETPSDCHGQDATSTETPSSPARCRGEPVTTERFVTDDPGYDDGIEHYPSNGTVRIVTVRSGDEPVAFESWSFEEWSRYRVTEIGQERVRAATARRLGTDEFGSGIGSPPAFASLDGPVVWLNLSTVLDQDGEVTSTPSVAFSTLVAHAPCSVEATVSLDGERYERTVPVYAETTTIGVT